MWAPQNIRQGIAGLISFPNNKILRIRLTSVNMSSSDAASGFAVATWFKNL